MKKHNLAFIDLETTGFDPERHEILEIGGIIVKQIPVEGRGPKLEVIEEFEYKVKPEHLETADPEALRINSYNDADWLFASNLESVMKEVQTKTADCIMAGQNVYFDFKFLEAAFKKTGLENKMHYHRLDLIPMAFAKNYHNNDLGWYNLDSLARFYGISNDKAHTALADIRTTFEIYKKVLEIE